MAPFDTILVTTDLSDSSAPALEPALAIASRFGSRLLVVHVVEDRLPPFVDEFTAVPFEEILQAQERRAAEALQAFLAARLPAGSPAESVVLHGTPHLEIVRLAEERGAGLIVLATHGHGFLAHALFGSTTERVLRRAPCPVLTVRSHPA